MKLPATVFAGRYEDKEYDKTMWEYGRLWAKESPTCVEEFLGKVLSVETTGICFSSGQENPVFSKMYERAEDLVKASPFNEEKGEDELKPDIYYLISRIMMRILREFKTVIGQSLRDECLRVVKEEGLMDCDDGLVLPPSIISEARKDLMRQHYYGEHMVPREKEEVLCHATNALRAALGSLPVAVNGREKLIEELDGRYKGSFELDDYGLSEAGLGWYQYDSKECEAFMKKFACGAEEEEEEGVIVSKAKRDMKSKAWFLIRFKWSENATLTEEELNLHCSYLIYRTLKRISLKFQENVAMSLREACAKAIEEDREEVDDFLKNMEESMDSVQTEFPPIPPGSIYEDARNYLMMKYTFISGPSSYEISCQSAEALKTALEALVTAEATTEATTETKTEAKTQAKTQAKTEATTEVKTEATTETKTQAKTQATAEATAEAKTQATAEATTEATTSSNKKRKLEWI